MLDYCWELHFSGSQIVELVETRFSCISRGVEKTCVRGKTPGAYQGAGTFQWSSAVRGLALLCLRHAVGSPAGGSDEISILRGEGGSLAASLDYAITKQPLWVSEMFGVDDEGTSLVRCFIRRNNSNRKRPGPVELSFYSEALPSEAIHVFLEGRRVEKHEELRRMLHTVEAQVMTINGGDSAGSMVRVAA